MKRAAMALAALIFAGCGPGASGQIDGCDVACDAGGDDASDAESICHISSECPLPVSMPQCMSPVCDPERAHGYDGTGPLGCYLVPTEDGAACVLMNGGVGVCSAPGNGGATMCCPPSGPC